MDHKVHVFAGLKKIHKTPPNPKQEKNQPKNQISCFIFIYSMVILHKLPHRYLKTPLKVQNNLVFNLVGSASRGIKLQLTISFSWSLLSHTEALQNYFGDWLLTVTEKSSKEMFLAEFRLLYNERTSINFSVFCILSVANQGGRETLQPLWAENILGTKRKSPQTAVNVSTLPKGDLSLSDSMINMFL